MPLVQSVLRTVAGQNVTLMLLNRLISEPGTESNAKPDFHLPLPAPMYAAAFEASSMVSGRLDETGPLYSEPVSVPEPGTIMPRIVGVPK
jgi:hypothetical protein